VYGDARGLKIVIMATMNPPSPPTSIAGIRIPMLPSRYSRHVNAAENIASSTSTIDFVVVPWMVITPSAVAAGSRRK
jgi:hypothetical protein